MKYLLQIILSFTLVSCAEKRPIIKLSPPYDSGKHEELKKTKEVKDLQVPKKNEEGSNQKVEASADERQKMETSKNQEALKLDSNNDGVTDIRANELNLQNDFSVFPNFEITDYGNMSLTLYSGDDNLNINLTPYTPSINPLIGMAKKEFFKSLSQQQEKGIFDNFDDDLFPITHLSTLQHEKFKNFLEQHKIINHAEFEIPIEIGGENNTLITKREISSVDLIIRSGNSKIIQAESFQRGGQNIQWYSSESIKGEITGEIKYMTDLYKLTQAPFDILIKISNTNYDLENKQLKSKEVYTSILTKSSEIIYMDNGILKKYLIQSGKSLGETLSSLNIKPTAVILEENFKNDIWYMLPLKKFLFVSRGLSNDNKTMPGKKYFLITSTPEEIMNYGNNEYE